MSVARIVAKAVASGVKATPNVSKAAKSAAKAAKAIKDATKSGKVGKIFKKVEFPSKNPWEKIIDLLPKTSGAKGGFELSGENMIRMLTQNLPDNKLKKAIDAFLEHALDPRVSVAYKNSKNGYSIAGFKLYDRNSAVATGAISMTNPGQANNVVKARLSLGRSGEALSASGFVDGAQKVDLLADDVAYSVARRAGKGKIDVSVDGKAAVHATLTPEGNEMARVARYFGESYKYAKFQKDFIAKVEKPTEVINEFLQLVTTGKKAQAAKAASEVSKTV